MRLFFTIGGKPNQGVRFFLKYAGVTPADADLNTYAVAVNTAWAAGGGPNSFMSNQIEYTGCTLEDLTSPTSAVGGLPAAVTGSHTDAYVTADAAFVVGYLISRRYRGGHPRGYWPLGVEAFLASDQEWAAASVTNMTAGIVQFFSTLLSTGLGAGVISAQVNVSYYEGFTAVENPLTHRYRNVPDLRVAPQVDTVEGYEGRSYVGSQRRRRNKI